jgi:hypothetical protein
MNSESFENKESLAHFGKPNAEIKAPYDEIFVDNFVDINRDINVP